MNLHKNLKHLLFIDIETVTSTPTYDDLEERLKPLWDKKSRYLNEAGDKKDMYVEKGGIYAEFGKIIAVSLGCFYQDEAALCFKLKSFFGHDEKKILEDFKKLLIDKFDSKKLTFCAHNGKEFDYPYLCRRMLINNMPLPEALDISGKKPWEVNHLDTLEMWKFGDKKSYTSLELLAAALDIPTSKDGIDGSMVNAVYYKENNLPEIVKYCEKDVVVTARVYLKMMGWAGLEEKNIFYTQPLSFQH